MRLKLSKEQWDFVRKLGIADKDYTQDEIDEYVIETVYEHLMKRGWAKYDPDYIINEIGDMCESIIDAIEEAR